VADHPPTPPQPQPPAQADLFAVTEAPLPLHAWSDTDGADRLGVVMADVGGLLLALGKARQEADEQKTRTFDEKRRLLLALLDLMDAFERVFRSIEAKKDMVTPQMKKWIANFRTVYRMLNTALADQGVSRIENLDGGFDPHWHKVAEIVVDTSRPEGTIADEARHGYVWQGAVLRKAEVVVVRHTPVDDDGDDASADADDSTTSEADASDA
jgi:hypothetical protein